MKLFTKKGDPTSELNHAIEQVKSWDRYFNENPLEKKRIFGAVAKFRFILIGGSKEDWQKEDAIHWRAYHNNESKIEIRSSDVFFKGLKIAKEKPEMLWSFENYPHSLKHSELESYWKNHGYMANMRKYF